MSEGYLPVHILTKGNVAGARDLEFSIGEKRYTAIPKPNAEQGWLDDFEKFLGKFRKPNNKMDPFATKSNKMELGWNSSPDRKGFKEYIDAPLKKNLGKLFEGPGAVQTKMVLACVDKYLLSLPQ
jgi:hypothetical protein